jgi:hypothetical protein
VGIKSLGAGIIAAGLILALVGCVPIGEFDDGMTNHGDSPETATPIEGDENGDGKLSEFEKQLLAQNAPREFVMPDDSVVTIDPNEPLPPAVREALTALATSPEAVGAGEASIRDWADKQAEATGKSIVVVYSKGDGVGRMAWGTSASGRRTTGVVGGYDKSDIVSKVQSWADRMGYEMIVVG